MRIAVLGGAGEIGRTVVEHLLERSDASVIIADAREDVGRRLASRLGPRVSFVDMDAGRARTVMGAVEGSAVAVNCIGPAYRFALPIARAVLDAGVSGVDICDDSTPVEGLLALHDKAARRGLTWLTGMGWSPGITNLLALKGSLEMDRTERIDIRWVGSAADASGHAVIKHILYCVSGSVPTYRNGKWIRVPAFSDPEEIRFPYPLPTLTVVHAGHPEQLTLPRHIAVDDVTCKGTLYPRAAMEAVRLAVRMNLTRDDIAIEKAARFIYRSGALVSAAMRLSKKGPKTSAARVDISGVRHGQHRRVSFSLIDRISRMTAVPAAVAALRIVQGAISGKGVLPPEAALDPEPFLAALAEQGIVIHEERQVSDEYIP
ncbi:MAG: saccharopine dehydrogenase NADP-binding domain-containing protein [Polyangia bacterium]|jgi:saccharopine dehydrogenase-like NADP-dependent oxidoreductase|nr:saccharopine dehydrogenase NADP-binding domain-containing protein [Polyangia bacterium]